MPSNRKTKVFGDGTASEEESTDETAQISSSVESAEVKVLNIAQIDTATHTSKIHSRHERQMSTELMVLGNINDLARSGTLTEDELHQAQLARMQQKARENGSRHSVRVQYKDKRSLMDFSTI